MHTKKYAMNTPKEIVQSLLSRLPDICTLEDIQYHLYVVEKVRLGIEACKARGGMTQEEVEARLESKFTNS